MKPWECFPLSCKTQFLLLALHSEARAMTDEHHQIIGTRKRLACLCIKINKRTRRRFNRRGMAQMAATSAATRDRRRRSCPSAARRRRAPPKPLPRSPPRRPCFPPRVSFPTLRPSSLAHRLGLCGTYGASAGRRCCACARGGWWTARGNCGSPPASPWAAASCTTTSGRSRAYAWPRGCLACARQSFGEMQLEPKNTYSNTCIFTSKFKAISTHELQRRKWRFEFCSSFTSNTYL